VLKIWRTLDKILAFLAGRPWLTVSPRAPIVTTPPAFVQPGGGEEVKACVIGHKPPEVAAPPVQWEVLYGHSFVHRAVRDVQA
jgi:hypothetical protein